MGVRLGNLVGLGVVVDVAVGVCVDVLEDVTVAVAVSVGVAGMGVGEDVAFLVVVGEIGVRVGGNDAAGLYILRAVEKNKIKKSI